MTQAPQECSLTRLYCFSLPTLRLGLWGGSPVGFCPRYGSVSGVAALWVFAHVTAQSLEWQPCGFLHMLRLSLWGGSPMGFCTLRGGHIHTLT